MITLRKEVISLVSANMRARNRLALSIGVGGITIKRWLEKNSIMLTTAEALKIISEETGLSRDEMLVEDAKASRFLSGQRAAIAV